MADDALEGAAALMVMSRCRSSVAASHFRSGHTTSKRVDDCCGGDGGTGLE